ncbi:MAG: GPW/gp25 family protein [Bacteroides sp.]
MDKLKNIMDADAFLGRGWSFPPRLTENGTSMAAFEQDIEQSLQVLLSTSPGERVNRYDYGCPLRHYVFETITMEVTVQMRNDITRAITLFEPRITLEEVSFEEYVERGLLLIQLTYIINRTNSRSNMVYPFYLNEGTI